MATWSAGDQSQKVRRESASGLIAHLPSDDDEFNNGTNDHNRDLAEKKFLVPSHSDIVWALVD